MATGSMANLRRVIAEKKTIYKQTYSTPNTTKLLSEPLQFSLQHYVTMLYFFFVIEHTELEKN